MEHSGIAPTSLAGSNTGVFVGLATHDYLGMASDELTYPEIEAYMAIGTSNAAAAGRISFRLGLQGPAVAVDTACSSSLVAIHQACQALRLGECDLALAGGANVLLTPATMITFSSAHMLAPDGRCKTFDAAADGYVRGEGCGVIVVKRLEDALRDGDRIRAAQVDASDAGAVADLARQVGADVVLNACDPWLNPSIFDAAFTAGCHYVDMAMNTSIPHPTEPYAKVGRRLGDAQFAQSPAWKNRGLMALVGMGVEPGFSDVAARYAADHLFSRIEEIGVRDGADLVVEGYDFAPTFSIWTTIEECLNPPVIYERDRGWFTTEPFSEPEIFTFPEGIGPIQCVNVEHEEVILIPRWIDVERVTFKYGLGRDFTRRNVRARRVKVSRLEELLTHETREGLRVPRRHRPVLVKVEGAHPRPVGLSRFISTHHGRVQLAGRTACGQPEHHFRLVAHALHELSRERLRRDARVSKNLDRRCSHQRGGGRPFS